MKNTMVRQGWNGDGIDRAFNITKVDAGENGSALWALVDCDKDETAPIDLGYIVSKREGGKDQAFEVWSGEGRAFSPEHKGLQYGFAPTLEGAIQIVLNMPRCEHCGRVMLPNDSCPGGCVGYDSLEIERLQADLASVKAELKSSNACAVRLLNTLEKIQTLVGNTLEAEKQN